jgi:P4 family phage/plasmid primase-like protien
MRIITLTDEVKSKICDFVKHYKTDEFIFNLVDSIWEENIQGEVVYFNAKDKIFYLYDGKFYDIISDDIAKTKIKEAIDIAVSTFSISGVNIEKERKSFGKDDIPQIEEWIESYTNLTDKNLDILEAKDIKDTLKILKRNLEEINTYGSSLVRSPDDNFVKKYYDTKSLLVKYVKDSLSTQRIFSHFKMLSKYQLNDRNIFNKETFELNLNNGILNMKTLELRPHSKNDYWNNILDYDYDPSATCPNVMKLLDMWFGNNISLKKYIQCLFGYCLTGENSQRYFWYFIGQPATGKSTIIDIFKLAFGDFYKDAPKKMFISNDVISVKEFHMKRLCTCGEISDKDTIQMDLLKEWTGNDAVGGRNIYREDSNKRPSQAKIIMTGNSFPRGDFDEAFKQRIIAVPFSNVIEKNERPIDRTTWIDSFKNERSGMLNWLLQGTQMFRNHELENPPEDVVLYTESFRQKSDDLYDFKEEFIETVSRDFDYTKVNQRYLPTLKNIISLYESTNNKPLTTIEMSSRLCKTYCEPVLVRVGNERYRLFKGIVLKDKFSKPPKETTTDDIIIPKTNNSDRFSDIQ